MTDQIFWLFWAIYALILLFALYKTRREQVRERIPLKTAFVGFLGCLVWPLTAFCLVVYWGMTAKKGTGHRSDL